MEHFGCIKSQVQSLSSLGRTRNTPAWNPGKSPAVIVETMLSYMGWWWDSVLGNFLHSQWNLISFHYYYSIYILPRNPVWNFFIPLDFCSCQDLSRHGAGIPPKLHLCIASREKVSVGTGGNDGQLLLYPIFRNAPTCRCSHNTTRRKWPQATHD